MTKREIRRVSEELAGDLPYKLASSPRLMVFQNGTPCGSIWKVDGDKTVFKYDLEYLQAPKPVPIAHNLPLTKDAFVTQGGLHPYFHGLLSEGWLRNLQQAIAATQDEFELLGRYGDDLLGTTSVRPAKD